MRAGENFFNLYNHDFVRVAVAVPDMRVADPEFNAEKTIALLHEAARHKVLLVVFPELGLSAYSCDDLFHQRALLDAVEAALTRVVEATRRLNLVCIVGLPLEIDCALYNCAAVVSKGRILAVTPKTYLPNYREFYEARQFAPGDTALRTEIDLCGQTAIPFGADLLFQSEQLALLKFHIEICEDLWVPIPPSSFAALAGATLLVNLSASNITIGKSEYRHQLVGNQSARCLAAYLYSSAGTGESTTDLAWDGQALIYENGRLVAESERFLYDSHLLLGEIDLEHLAQERMRQTSFGQSLRRLKPQLEKFRTVRFPLEIPRADRLLPQRLSARFPYVPADPAKRDHRCREVYEIQVQGLVKRLTASGIRKVVIGVSGGLDSTQALLVCAHAMDLLKLPRSNILAYTMPAFATSSRTLAQAHELMRVIGASAHEIDIKPSCLQMLRDIGHPHSEHDPHYDVAFENVQAGERTSHLFRLANLHDGLVIGTGDLSELALGWCTYGVGDHMAHYSVNASVPKTLIKYLVQWVAQSGQLGPAASDVLLRVLGTEISPELVPGAEKDAPQQKTEHFVGPYELQDFNLYYTLRFGYQPAKIAFLAYMAWRDRTQGRWPDLAEEQRNEYAIAEIKKWLGVFLYRFFKTSQFKRSCVPNAPKVGSGGSLSPRGDYRAPSDSEAAVWMATLDLVPEADDSQGSSE